MRTFLIILLVLLSFQWVQGQQSAEEPKVGEILVVGPYYGIEYDHIHFPKLNLVLKRGGLGNWTSLRGTKVFVKEKYQNSDGETFAVLERTDGRRFLKVIPSVTTSFKQALESGELRRL